MNTIIPRQMVKDLAVKPHKKGNHPIVYQFHIQKVKGFSTFSDGGVIVTTTHTNSGTYTEFYKASLSEVEQVIATYKMWQKFQKMGFNGDYEITLESNHYSTSCSVLDHGISVNDTHYMFV